MDHSNLKASQAFPDYDNSILGIPNSILKHFNLPAYHPGLPILDGYLAKGFRQIVLLVLDGMGIENMDQLLPRDSRFLTNRVGDISSVFPPTTTAATTTLKTGRLPMEHGWLGWSLYFPELSDNIDLYPNTRLDGSRFLPYHAASRYLPFLDIIASLNEAARGSQEPFRAMEISPFSSPRALGMENLGRNLETALRRGERSFIYAYSPDIDSAMHKFGAASLEAYGEMVKAEKHLMNVIGKAKDTLFIITADHGLIDSDNRWLGNYGNITEQLTILPAIEPRALSFRVKAANLEGFKDTMADVFGEAFITMSRQEVLDSGLFGCGMEHPRFRESLGDYLAIAAQDIALFNSQGAARTIKGTHGGFTEAEMRVPLIIFET